MEGKAMVIISRCLSPFYQIAFWDLMHRGFEIHARFCIVLVGVDGCNENSETEAPLGNGNPKVHAPRGSRDLDPLECAKKRNSYEAEEIKRRALEEAEAIRSSARLSGSVPIRSTLRNKQETPASECVTGGSTVDVASDILRFAQSFASEARAEAKKALADARATAEQILSSARSDAAVFTSSSSATLGDKERQLRLRDANRKRRSYWINRRNDGCGDQLQSMQDRRAPSRDRQDRTIRDLVTDLVRLFVKRTMTFSMESKQSVCQRFWVHRSMRQYHPASLGCNYTGPWTLHNVHLKKPADVVDYVEAMGHGEGIENQWDEGTLIDLVEVGDFFAVEAEWPNDYDAEFWILQCIKPLHVLPHSVTDAYGETHDVGPSMLKGIWYQQFGKSPTCFVRYDSAPESVVAARRVIHVRFALSPTGVLRNSPSLKLSNDTLEAILASLQR
ncbi:hypothetical protein R1sor_023916 [Riccia sorocarpa]|uniref:START domain-containing protein n=1 Tax=Riccia sorocarpa TaxID=122646 RepID=A0ABD3GS82_9MARC